MNNNPYEVSDLVEYEEDDLLEYCDIGVFSGERVGRVRFFCYLSVSTILLVLMVVIHDYLKGAPSYVRYPFGAGLVVGIIVYGFCLYSIFTMRIHDLGWERKYSFSLLAPVVNVIFLIFVFILPGQEDTNDYGYPPPPNTPIINGLAVAILSILIIGILSSVAITHYEKYKKNSVYQQQDKINIYKY